MEKQEVNKDDIVEYILTFGINRAVQKFEITKETARDVLNEFVRDNSTRCPCKLSRGAFCINCTGDEMSFSLKERLTKI